MKTFLKVTLLVLLALVIIKLSPLLFIPAGVMLALLCGIGGVVAAVLLGLCAGALGLVLVLLLGLLIVCAVLSPIWVPVLLLCGILSLCRRSRHRTVST